MINDKDWLTTSIDCDDNSCLFRDKTKPGGMRTNGGCRCFQDLSTLKQRLVHKMLKELLDVGVRIGELEAEIEDQKDELRNLYAGEDL